MRFKEYLIEKQLVKWSQEDIDIKTAIDLLNKHCKNGLKSISNNGLLYRGFKHGKSIYTIDASTGERSSKDTNNLYQLMMDNSTALIGYPKRTKSLICSSSLEEAAGYGTPSVVIPYDEIKIICSDEDDFFRTDLGKLVDEQDIEEVSELIEIIFVNSGLKQKSQYLDISLLDNHIRKNKEEFIKEWKGYFGKDISKFIEGNKPFTDLSSLIMNPKDLHIFSQDFGEPINRNVECWFSGPCVVIDARLFAGILQALSQSGFKIGNRIKSEFASHFGKIDNLEKFVVDYIRKNS